ncbi:hypothetical protein BpHYR1_054436 [Brachionus plicatilis]|uniref:Uncharacterized protein n=1 Tax=Brachionus plicatilis TaxID=10195 RepID=A0A3M7SIK8_BRAPC|nr:hypothetical protein BpHYR1_054436 [Brachionus plicatilis]
MRSPRPVDAVQSKLAAKIVVEPVKSSISITKLPVVNKGHDEDFLLKVPLDYISEPIFKTYLSTNGGGKGDSNQFQNGKGKNVPTDLLKVDSHGDLSVSKPVQVAVPVMTADAHKDVNQSCSNESIKNVNINKEKNGNSNSILSPEPVIYGPGSSNQLITQYDNYNRHIPEQVNLNKPEVETSKNSADS